MVTKQTEQLLQQALVLPEPERAELAAKLLETLDGPAELDVDSAWVNEVERRCAALDAGKVATGDWESLRSRIEGEVFGRCVSRFGPTRRRKQSC